MILVAHHCCLRTAEHLEVRTGDVAFARELCMLVLRDTKIGGRIGAHEEVTVLDKWSLGKLKELLPRVTAGHTLAGLSGHEFRRIWKQAIAALKLDKRTQPYGLRRGGATAWFQASGSFAKVAERGRWKTLKALRLYITTALQEMASGTTSLETLRLCEGFAQRLVNGDDCEQSGTFVDS